MLFAKFDGNLLTTVKGIVKKTLVYICGQCLSGVTEVDEDSHRHHHFILTHDKSDKSNTLHI